MTAAAAAAAGKRRRGLSAVFWSGAKIVISVSAVLCVLSLLRIRSEARLQTAVSEKVGEFGRWPVRPFAGTPRVAFLFLARSNLPLDFLWRGFFQNAEEGRFSIYIHSGLGFVFNESTTRCPYFYDRQIRQSIRVKWGESSMIRAEQLLLGAALQDSSNQRFILLSDSCAPLYNFSYVYNYVISSSKSFVDSFLDAKEGRYNPKMSPVIPKDKWRKGSQWIALTRKHAEVVVADDVIFSIFNKYCKRRPALEPSRKHLSIVQKEHNCIPDEHYIQTLFAMSKLEDEIEPRTITYTVWNESANKMEGNRWHPITFEYADASPEKINKIKEINHVYYQTEHRTEWCRSNGTFVPCFLFARKYSRGAAMRLLREGVVGTFDATALLT